MEELVRSAGRTAGGPGPRARIRRVSGWNLGEGEGPGERSRGAGLQGTRARPPGVLVRLFGALLLLSERF